MSNSGSEENKNTQSDTSNPPVPDIFQMAQKIAKDIPKPEEGKPIDMQNMVKHVTDSVMNMMGNGEVDINGMTSNLMQNLMNQQGGSGNIFENLMDNSGQQSVEPSYKPIPNSKITLPGQEKKSNEKAKKQLKYPKEKNSNFEELDDDDDEADELNPRTRDIKINLNVDLKDLFTGTKKKLAVRRKRLKKDAKGNIKPTDEKKKIIIPIEPGMKDEQVIIFNKEADEALGHETGDIVITLCENAHSVFEREGDNLFIMKDISLYEAFAAASGEKLEMTVKHLDGTVLKLKTDGKPLHDNDGIRKIVDEGMPYYRKNGKGDLYVRFNLVLPDKFKDEDIPVLKKLFPALNECDIPKDSKIRDVILEEVSESDLEDLDYYSDDSGDDSFTSESSEESRHKYKKRN